MAIYNTCRYCGANLDPGEKCDCCPEKAKTGKSFDCRLAGNEYSCHKQSEAACKNSIAHIDSVVNKEIWK